MCVILNVHLRWVKIQGLVMNIKATFCHGCAGNVSVISIGGVKHVFEVHVKHVFEVHIKHVALHGTVSVIIGTQAIDDDWWYLMMCYDHQISWMGRTKHLNRIVPANYFDELLLLAYTVACCNQPQIYLPVLKGGKLQRLHVWIRNTSVFDLVHMFMTNLSFLHRPKDSFTATQRKTV